MKNNYQKSNYKVDKNFFLLPSYNFNKNSTSCHESLK